MGSPNPLGCRGAACHPLTVKQMFYVSSRETAVRTGLYLLAGIDGFVGAWAMMWPSAFYGQFPGLGMHWVAAEGPYSEHVTTDFGGALLAIAVALVLAAVVAQQRLMEVALVAALLQSAQHLTFHLMHFAVLPTRELVLERMTLAAPVMLAVALLILLGRDHQPSSAKRNSSDP